MVVLSCHFRVRSFGTENPLRGWPVGRGSIDSAYFALKELRAFLSRLAEPEEKLIDRDLRAGRAGKR